MANGLNMHELAREGAANRLQQLEAQATAIRRAFPGIGRITVTERDIPQEVGRKRRHYGMSLKARKAQSARMKLRWKAYRANHSKAA